MTESELHAKWVTPPKLGKDAEKELARIIKSKIDSDRYNRCVQTLEDSTIILTINGPISKAYNDSEAIKQIRSLEKSVARAIKSLQEMPDLQKQLIDESCYLANDQNKKFLGGANGSTVCPSLEQIHKGLLLRLENTAPTNKKQYYTATAIRYLANELSNILPNFKPSDHPNSFFARLVKFWLREYVGCEIEKPHRHIQSAIAKDPK